LGRCSFFAIFVVVYYQDGIALAILSKWSLIFLALIWKSPGFLYQSLTASIHIAGWRILSAVAGAIVLKPKRPAHQRFD